MSIAYRPPRWLQDERNRAHGDSRAYSPRRGHFENIKILRSVRYAEHVGTLAGFPDILNGADTNLRVA